MSEKKIKAKTSDQKYWGLIPGCRDKRQQYRLDQDYIEILKAQLNHSDPIKVQTAKEALDFLNAFMLAELDGNLKELNALGIIPSKEWVRGANNSQNSAKRDYVANNSYSRSGFYDHLTNEDTLPISELHDDARDRKRISMKIKRIRRKTRPVILPDTNEDESYE